MGKDILDKLALKNKENLSSTNFETNTVLGISRTLDSLKINDDFSNNEMIIDEGSPQVHNSYVSLADSISKDKKFEITNENGNKVDLASYTLHNKI